MIIKPTLAGNTIALVPGRAPGPRAMLIQSAIHPPGSRPRHPPADFVPSRALGARPRTDMTDPDLQQLFERLDRVRRQFADLVGESAAAAADRGQAGGDWSEPLAAWWQRERRHAPPDVAELYGRLVEQGRVLFRLAEHLGNAPGRSDASGDAFLELVEVSRRQLGEFWKLPAFEAAGALSPFGQLLDHWRTTALALLGYPGGGAGDAGGAEASAASWAHVLLGGLPGPDSAGAPGASPADLQRLMEAWTAYLDQFNRLARLAVESAAGAVSQLEAELEALPSDEPLGVRDLYALWLKCCESTYADISRTDEFPEILGGLANSAFRLRAARQRLLDSAAAALGMPTRADIEDLAAVLHETRRELRGATRASAGGNTPARTRRASKKAATRKVASRRAPAATTATAATTRKKATRAPARKKKTAGARASAGKRRSDR